MTVALGVATLTFPGVSVALGAVKVAAASGNQFAYANGGARSPGSCPKTAQRARQCGLAQALARVKPGGSVLLATGGKAAAYYGNFVIGTRRTSASKPVTIKPAPGVRNPVIDGDAAAKVRCPTTACTGSILTVGSGVVADLRSFTITDGRDTGSHGGGGIDDMGSVSLTNVTITRCSAEVGGGIVVAKGARLAVAHSVLSSDRSTFFGGAIDSGSVIAKVAGTGRVTVTDSVFAHDSSQRGGAIDSGDGGTGTLTISRSTFSSDSASVHGGAIDNADSGHGTLTVTDSTFSRDSARFGGAIDNADSDGVGALTITSSTFSRDSAFHGGAIDNGERGNGTVTIRTSTFSADHATKQGAVFDTGDAGGTGAVVILNTTINGSLGTAAIARVAGTLQVAGSILAGSLATCTRNITDLGYNLVAKVVSGCGFSAETDLVGFNPRLGPLSTKGGGPTATMVPSSTSPVLERIPNPGIADLNPGRPTPLCPVPDQRGLRKNEAVGCTIGSVDPASNVPVVTSLGPAVGPAVAGGAAVIHGGNFSRGATVSFGHVRATHSVVISATQIDVTVPALPASDSSATVAVTVRNTPSGPASPSRAAAIYTYYTGDWSAYLGGSAHSSYDPAATSITPASMANVEPIWQWNPPASPNTGLSDDDASPIVSDGVVYVGLEDGEFYALSEATQQVLWSRFLGVEVGTTCDSGTLGIISTATVTADPTTGTATVYVNGPDGYLYALDAATGNVVWKSVVGIPSSTVNDYFAWGSPTVANGKVYIGIASNCDIPLVHAGVLSFDQHSGKKLAYWDSLPPAVVGGSVWSSVAVLPNGDVAATTGNAFNSVNIPNSESIAILDGSTLKLQGAWQAPQSQASGDSDFGASPTVFVADPNGVKTTMVGACNKDGVYYALRPDDMAAGPLWTYRMGIPTSGAASNECDAAAIWNGRYLIEGGGSQAVINGTTYDGSVQALDPTTGKPVWRTGLDGWVVGSPSENGAGVIAAPVLFSPTDAGHGPTGVYLLSASTGKILKFISTEPQGNFAQPVFGGNDLLVGNESQALPLTAYAVTTPASGQSGPLGVSPPVITKSTTVTLTLTATSGLTAGANVIVSGAQVEVQSVQVTSPTTASVQIKVLSDAESGTALDVTLVEPDLTAYTCTQCLAIS